MNAGDVFRFEGIAERHVWMIISDPRRDPSKILIVNFSTWEPHLDQACIIEPGDHPFVVHRSVANYPRSRVVADAQLEQLLLARRMTLLDPLSPTLLQRIRDAAMTSTRIPIEHADILIEQELVE